MSTNAIQAALSGLSVAQRQLDVASRNTANVGTDGYTRKILPQETNFAGPIPLGVRSGEVYRQVDEYLTRDLWRQESVMGDATASTSYLQRIMELHGRPDEESSLAARINALGNVFVELTAQPDSYVLYSDAIDQATAVTKQFNVLGQAMVDCRNDVIGDITCSVDNINESLDTIARLNVTIQREYYNGHSTADLEDRRDMEIRTLGKQIEFTYYKRGDNTIVVQSNRGHILADHAARQLHYEPKYMTAQMSYPSAGGTIRLEDPATGVDFAAFGPGGRLGALIHLRDEIYPQQIAQLDELAHKMAMRFEAQDLQMFTDMTGTVPADTAGGYVGFATEIQVNDAVILDPSLVRTGTGGAVVNPGSNEIITRIAQFTFGREEIDFPSTDHPPFRTIGLGPDGSVETELLSKATLEEYARHMIIHQSERHAAAETRQQFEQTYHDTLEHRLLTDTAVNLDEEMSHMMEIQQAYSASARMLQMVRTMFDELTNLL
ncbi:MAG: flagellar hook-associated protein FlgK [Pseudomonadota bacterium]|nr:flagellar hook-associated protein FlgK [Pseudomonadota bacterium]